MSTCMTAISDIDKFVKTMDGWGGSAYASEKLDGVRVMAMVFPRGEVLYYSRTGKPLKNFDRFTKDLIELRKACVAVKNSATIVFDGEMTATDDRFSSVMRQLRRIKDVDPSIFHYNIFDIQHTAKLTYRYTALQDAFKKHCSDGISLVPHTPVIVHSEDFLNELLKDAVAKGQEGVVLKNMSSNYEFKRSNQWLKLKAARTLDLPVVGYKEGTGKYTGMLGTLTVEYNGQHVEVGTGFSDAERDELMKNIPRLIEVEFQQESSRGKLRHPRFIQIRDDKVEHD